MLIITDRILLFCFLLYFLGLFWIFLFPISCITCGETKCRGTYISENGLLIGYSDPDFGNVQMEWAKLYQSSINTSRRKHPSKSEIISDIVSKLNVLDVDVEIQRFNTTNKEGYPVELTNIYTISHSYPLNDNKEAIVICAPYHDAYNFKKGNSINNFPSSLAFALSFFKHLRNLHWLSKDIILLIADGEDLGNIGIHEWLKTYHADPFESKDFTFSRSGVLRSAFFINIPEGVSWNTLVVSTEGINGRLPNLDLFNTIIKLSTGTNVEISKTFDQDNNIVIKIVDFLYYQLNLPLTRDSLIRYIVMMKNVIRYICNLAIGNTGPHSHFLNYNIDAVSLYGVTSNNNNNVVEMSSKHVVNLGITLEQTIHSISNIEERLHQSYFLYLLPSIYNFTSIDEYAFTLALISLSLLLCAYSIIPLSSDLDMPIFVTGLSYIIIGGLSFFLYNSYFDVITILTSVESATILALTFCLVFHLAVPVVMNFTYLLAMEEPQVQFRITSPRSKNRISFKNGRSTVFLTMFMTFFGLVLYGIVNFAFASISAIVMVPMLFASLPVDYNKFGVLLFRMIFLLLLSPQIIFLLFSGQIIKDLYLNRVPFQLIQESLRSYNQDKSLTIMFVIFFYIPTHALSLYTLLFNSVTRSMPLRYFTYTFLTCCSLYIIFICT